MICLLSSPYEGGDLGEVKPPAKTCRWCLVKAETASFQYKNQQKSCEAGIVDWGLDLTTSLYYRYPSAVPFEVVANLTKMEGEEL